MNHPEPTEGRSLLRYLEPQLWGNFLSHIVRQADARLFGVDFAQYHRVLRGLVLDGGCQSLLDVGCGSRSPVAAFATEIRRRVGLDAHRPSVERSCTSGIHTEYVVGDLLAIEEQFEPRSFDCVLLLEVVEHFQRVDGEKLLQACERIARKKVVVSTPNGFVPQPPEPGNPLQEHLSGWTAEEFSRRGYRVTGIAGWKPLRGPYLRPRWRPHSLFRRLSLLSEPWCENHPERAFQILCMKRIVEPAALARETTKTSTLRGSEGAGEFPDVRCQLNS